VAADTWGISPEDFTQLWFALAAGTIVLALIVRSALKRAVVLSGGEPVAEALAYFAGGPRRAVVAALAGLRLADAVAGQPDHTVVVTGRSPDAPSALAWAVYRAAHQRGATFDTLARDAEVAAALDSLRDTLLGNGWLLSRRTRAAIRMAALPVFAVVTFGAVRTVAGLGNGRPIGFAITMTVLLLIVALALLAPPAQSQPGRQALTSVHARNAHLDPGSGAAPYGPATVVLAVGLFGAPALERLDPVLGAAAAAWTAET
jgi:uncharacterized protein (TIGR04222 family)